MKSKRHQRGNRTVLPLISFKRVKCCLKLGEAGCHVVMDALLEGFGVAAGHELLSGDVLK